MLSLENELIKITVLLDKGADIVEIISKKRDVDFLWKKPGGIRETSKYILSTPSDSGNFEDYYAGGWQEVLPGGGPCKYKGANLGLHGETALLPWGFKVIHDAHDEVCVELFCKTYRVPFSIQKRITIKSNESAIYFSEVLNNECNESLEFIWGQHPVYGSTFVDSECIIDTNATEIIASGNDTYPDSEYKANDISYWPNINNIKGECDDLSTMRSAQDKSAELFFLGGFKEDLAWYALTNPKKNLGVALVWDAAVYKHLWMWRVCNGSPGYPLYGRSYHLALEPFSSYPNNLYKAIENGSATKLNGYGKIETFYVFVVYEGCQRVTGVDKTGKVIKK